jgi:hypothetical protein
MDRLINPEVFRQLLAQEVGVHLKMERPDLGDRRIAHSLTRQATYLGLQYPDYFEEVP